jgi:hypothetical protein
VRATDEPSISRTAVRREMEVWDESGERFAHVYTNEFLFSIDFFGSKQMQQM